MCLYQGPGANRAWRLVVKLLALLNMSDRECSVIPNDVSLSCGRVATRELAVELARCQHVFYRQWFIQTVALISNPAQQIAPSVGYLASSPCARIRVLSMSMVADL